MRTSSPRGAGRATCSPTSARRCTTRAIRATPDAIERAGIELSAVLVLFATREGHTARIAERIALLLRARGHRVDVSPATTDLRLADYGGVIVGASVHYGQHPASLARLLRRHDLRGARTGFFSVSLGAKQDYATAFLRRARWKPDLVAVFAGALRYSRYPPLKRLVVRAFAAIAGHDTDTSRDYEYTDWKAVERFATAFSEALTSAS